MSNVPDDLKYTKKHEWARIQGNRVTVGITDHAQEELTDIVYIELPEVGKEVQAGDELATVESVKSTSDVYSPVSGKVVEVNSALVDSSGDINADPYGKGWLAIIECLDTNSPALISAAEYKALLG
ncbi:MAG: glycine cleavage system protein GcvH [Thermoplasmata archaeon]